MIDGSVCLSCGLRHVISVSKNPCDLCRLHKRVEWAEKECSTLKEKLAECEAEIKHLRRDASWANWD